MAKLDNRIRENTKSDVVIGTIDCFLRMENAEVCVILDGGDLWIGLKREIQNVSTK